MVIIVDYGMGNLHSVLKAFNRLRIEAAISSEPEDILSANKLILPGVGNFKRGMSNLIDRKLVAPLNTAVIEKQIPILGICLGMQLMTNYSQEGDEKGLGWFDAETLQFDFSDNLNQRLHIPHIGWNTINIAMENLLFNNIDDSPSFYFVHSYFVKCNAKDDVAATTEYGSTFVSAIAKNNIFATQFHPEKSHDYGLTLLKNFTDNT